MGIIVDYMIRICSAIRPCVQGRIQEKYRINLQ